MRRKKEADIEIWDEQHENWKLFSDLWLIKVRFHPVHCAMQIVSRKSQEKFLPLKKRGWFQPLHKKDPIFVNYERFRDTEASNSSPSSFSFFQCQLAREKKRRAKRVKQHFWGEEKKSIKNPCKIRFSWIIWIYSFQVNSTAAFAMLHTHQQRLVVHYSHNPHIAIVYYKSRDFLNGMELCK